MLSGGGSLGAVQVGMLRALAERGVAPDLLVGTSAGALNAVFVAAHGTGPESLDVLAATWAALRRDDVFPLRAPQMVLALAGARDALCAGSGLERLVRRNVPFDRLEEAPVPVHLVTTDLLSGEEVLLSDGDVVSAVLASSAIPAVLPPVRRDGRTLVDGGLANNAAISQAIDLGADRIYVLPTGYACALSAPPSRPLAVAVQALSLLVQRRLIADVALSASQVGLVVLPRCARCRSRRSTSGTPPSCPGGRTTRRPGGWTAVRRTARGRNGSSERPHPVADEPPDLPVTPEEFAAEAAMRDAEIAVVQHRATEDQQLRVRAMAAVRTRDGRRRIWMDYVADR